MNYIKFLSIIITFILSLSLSNSLVDYSKLKPKEAHHARKNQTESNSRNVTGTLISSFQGPTQAIGLTFDGTHLWISDRQEDLIKKYTLSGEMVSSISGPSPGSDQRGLAWDGQNIWLACANPYSIYKLDPSDGTILNSFDYSGSGYPNGITFDGASNLWVNGWGSSSLIAYDPETFEQVTELYISGGGRGLTFDGTHLWYASDSFVRKINLEGQLIETYDLPNTYVPGLAFDGQYIWASNMNSGMVYQYDVGIEITYPENSTYVPDDNFEQALIDLGYDDVLDDAVLTSNINAITELNVSDRSISDLTGIEAMVALTNLNCDQNLLTSIDLSTNIALVTLNANGNQLGTIDLTANTVLQTLALDGNQLSYIDVSLNTALVNLMVSNNFFTTIDITQNTSLEQLFLYGNQLTMLDVSSNTGLFNLFLNHNQLTNLDVSSNPALVHLSFTDNQVSEIDLSSNTSLEVLHLENNQLVNIDLSSNLLLQHLRCADNPLGTLDVTANVDLRELHCQDNGLTELNIENNTLLTDLFCEGNLLTSLDVSVNTQLINLYCNHNQLSFLGTNQNFSLLNLNCQENQLTSLDVASTSLSLLNAQGNPELTCIHVGNLAPIENLILDENQFLSETPCVPLALNTYVPDDNFEQALIELGFDDVLDDSVLTENVASVPALVLMERGISDLTGIEAFTSLNFLDVMMNQLTSVDLSSNTALLSLSLPFNELTELNLSSNTELFFLNLNENQLTELDLSSNIHLSELNLRRNQLSTIDLSLNTNLSNLNISRNDLVSINLSMLPELINLNLRNNLLAEVNVYSNTLLNELELQNNLLSGVDLSSNVNLEHLDIHNNQLTELDLSFNDVLFRLDATLNPDLTCIQVSDMNMIMNLQLDENQFLSEVSCDEFITKYSLQFDGEDDYIEIPTGIVPTDGDYSVQVWAKHDNVENPGFDHIVAQHNNFYIGTDPSNMIRVSDAWINTGIEYQSDTWVNLALVKTSENTKLYQNGILAATFEGDLDNPRDNSLFIGKQFGDLTEHWSGNIDQLSIFNIALTETQVLGNLHNPIPGDANGLVGLWTFDEGMGDVLVDQSPNQNNGIIYGATWSEDLPENIGENYQLCPPSNLLAESATEANILTWAEPGGCEDEVINQLPFYYIGNNIESGDDWMVSQGVYQGNDVAFKLTLDEPTMVNVSTCHTDTDYDTKLSIFNSCGGDELFYNDDPFDEEGEASCQLDVLNAMISNVNLEAGTYYIVVDGFDGETGNFGLSVETSTMRGTNSNQYTFNSQLTQTVQKMQRLGVPEFQIEHILKQAENRRANNQSSPNNRTIDEDCGILFTYRVFNALNNTLIAETTELTYTHSNLDPNQEYCYYVTALYQEGESISSNSDCAFPFPIELAGCTDPFADNYNPYASENDGSCTYDPDFSDNYSFLGTFENSSYYQSENNLGLDWNEASTHSNGQGGHLATLSTELENSIVSALASDLSLIGLSQNLNSPEYSEPTGGWEWVTGQPLDFTSWGSGEPNNDAGDQHYAVTNWSNIGIWDDQRLSQTVGLSYIMERSNEFVLGCTDIYADNFNESATEDDGSCFGYPNNGDFSINFDGEGAHVNMGSHESIDLDGKSFSIDLWFKLDDTENEQMLITKWNEHSVGESVAILTRNNSTLAFAFVYDDLDVSLNLVTDEWYYVCATFDAETRERNLYVNGNLMGTDIASTVLTNSDDGNWTMGTRSFPTEPLNFAGSIDDVGIFNEILSDEQVSERFNQNYNENYPYLISSYNFDFNEGDIAFDHSGNQNHGVINGASWNEFIYGCMDPLASNYNPDANIEDGSCYGYPQEGDYSLSFDGVDDYSHLDWEEDLDNYTVAMWVKSNELTQSVYNAFFSTHNPNSSGFQLDSDGSSRLRMLTPDFELILAPALPNNWTHVAVVAETDGDFKQTTVYFNGDSVTSANDVESGWNRIDLGRNRNNTQPGNYTLDDIAIWDVPVAQEDIRAHMQGIIHEPEDLIVEWNLNEGQGNTIYDNSGNFNHALLFNDPTWVEDANVTVTFNFDAYGQTISQNGVHISGTFNNWSYTPMFDEDGDNIYTFSAGFTSGDTIQYKFINGNSFEEVHDIFVGDEVCVMASGDTYNRFTIISEEDMILDPVCINSCDPCDTPEIDVNPGQLNADLYVGESSLQDLTISNSGSFDLTWSSFVSFSEESDILESSPVFESDILPSVRGKINDHIVHDVETYVSSPIRMPINENSSSRDAGDTPLENILSSFNNNFESVNSVIPDRYDFNDGVTGNYIIDGGYDMYDYGNYLYTNLGSQPISYSDNVILDNVHLGVNNSYFTKKVDGLFVFAADIDIESFRIDGDIGADGMGSVDGAVLELDLYGRTFLGFVKRVWGSGDPSINHLIIIEKEEGITHEFEQGTYTDYHQVSGLTATSRIYYLLYAGGLTGTYIDNEETMVIMDAFLNSIELSPAWLSLDAETGETGMGESSNLGVTIDANNVDGGEYSANVVIVSNDPDDQTIEIPVNLTVTIPYPEIALDETEFSETIRISESQTESFMIRNNGVADLNWSISFLDINTLESPTWLTTLISEGITEIGDSSIVELTFNTESLEEGTYQAEMMLSHNDPSVDEFIIPVTMVAVVNEYPVFSSASALNATEDVLFIYQAVAEDPEGLELVIEFVDLPEWLTVSGDQVFGMPLEGTGDFNFTVTAFDGVLESELFVEVQYESVPDAPQSFDIVNPSPGAEITSLNVTFVWEESFDSDEGDVVNYTLLYGNSFSNLQSIDAGTELMWELRDDLLDNTTYYWKVVATDLLGLTSESSGGYQNFTVNTANDLPGAFALYTPENLSMVTDLTPTFMWEVPNDPDDGQSSSSQPVNRNGQSSLGVNHNNFSALLPSRGSNARSVTTAHVSNPGNNTINTRSIESFYFFLGSENTFTEVEPIIIGENTYTPEMDLLEDAIYYWKVVAVDDDSGATESEVHSFWTNQQNTAPSEFVLLTPAMNEETGLNPIFSWTESMDPDLNDALNYTLTYGSDLTFMNSVVIENSNNSASNTEPFENENYTALGEFQGNHYFLSNSTSLWSDANTMLDGMMGAHLATITSEEENAFLTEFVTQDTWIGLNDVAEEGVFEWVTGEEVTYTNWREGEPNNSNGNEPYVHMFRQGDWNDGEPDNEYFYIVEVESGSELSYVVEDGLQDHTEYFWQVTARDMSGATYSTSMQTFMVNSANENPEGFTLVSPENGTVVSSFDQLLVWNLSTDLDGDFIEFDVQLNGESIGVTYHNYIHVNGLAEDETYEWTVTATDNNDGFTQSDVWSFTVNTVNSAPQPFALLSPESEMMFNETSVTFEWEVSEDVDGIDEVMYHLEIHSDSLSMHYETYETSFIVDNLMDNHIYHWSVMAQDMNGAVTENMDGHRMFVVNVENEAPTQVSHITPTEESIETDLSPLFYWTEASDPDPMDMVSYHLILTQDIAGDMVQDVVIDSNSYSFESDLEDNSSYYWKVNTLDSYGLETMAPDYISFYTDAFPEAPLPFATVAPENDAAGIATEVEFVWNATIDPDPGDLVLYQLVYATDWNDSSTYLFTDFMEDTTVTIVLEDNRQYSWKVLASDDDEFLVGSDEDTPSTFVVGTLSIDGSNIPESFALHQNYPNPFNPTTSIKYDLPQDALVKISIYDIMGRNIKTLVSGNQSAGYQSVRWDATNNYGEPISAGMYIYTIQAGDFRQTKKMVLLK